MWGRRYLRKVIENYPESKQGAVDFAGTASKLFYLSLPIW
jgi:hypothetical protein